MPRIAMMLALVTAGELVFGLPFHTARFFRPTLLEVFNFTNTELGDLFAVYGITAMLAYFPGGALADRYSPRTLITVSLLSTAAGGLYMATLPGAVGMAVLYGFWGVTTVFLLWGALIKATREWGGQKAQGVAVGILEGGRGLVAAIVALIAVNVLAFSLPDSADLATAAERERGFQYVVLTYVSFTAVAGVLAWIALPDSKQAAISRAGAFNGMAIVLRRPIVWAQAAVIVCAYCCYKGLDNYSLYAAQVLGMDEVEAARLTSYSAWIRPLAALTAGVVADRVSASRPIGVLFAILVVLYFVWAQASPDSFGVNIIYFSFFTSLAAVFALRGVYFALLEENATPKFVTGAAVGMVSLVGYTPEVFFAPVAGRILDANPGIVGHQNYFLFLAGVAFAGVLVVAWLLWLQRQGTQRMWPGAEHGTK